MTQHGKIGLRWFAGIFVWTGVVASVASLVNMNDKYIFSGIAFGWGCMSAYTAHALLKHSTRPFRELPVWGFSFGDQRSIIMLYAVGVICCVLGIANLL